MQSTRTNTTAPQVDTGQPISRRDALKTIWAALGGMVALEVSGLALAYMQPRLAQGEFGSVISAGVVDDFPPNSVTHIKNGRFYLVRLADGGFLAVYQRCTHLGCTVPWDQEQGMFVCPCHNSQFSPDGQVLNPPAPRPLDLFPITIIDSHIEVNTGAPLAREAADPAQVVYP